MPLYRYQAYAATGSLETGTLEAASARDAARALAERGLLPFETVLVDRPPSRRTRLASLQLGLPTLGDYADIMRELGVLVQAGLPLDHALSVVTDQASRPSVQKLIQELHRTVTGGALLSAALEEHAITAPAYVAPLVRAGEARGSLGPTLAELARFLRARVEVDARVRSALTYPLVLAATAVAAVLVIMMFLVPALLPLFTESGIEPPFTLYALHAASLFVASAWPALLAMVLGVGFGVRSLLRHPEAGRALSALVLRLPVVGSISRATNVAILGRTLGTLLRHGVALVPALTMTAAALPNRLFAAALYRAAEGVREGRRLGPLLNEALVVPRIAVRFITIGEEASKLDDMLLHLGDVAETDAQRAVERAMTLLTPALTITIGLFVGGLILSVMNAILSVNQLALRP